MKFKTTNKQIKENYFTIGTGYCALQNLLNYETPTAYTCGVNGWNYDAYIFGNVAICTGYRGMSNTLEAPYCVIEKYDGIAADLINKQVATRENLSDLIAALIRTARAIYRAKTNKNRMQLEKTVLANITAFEWLDNNRIRLVNDNAQKFIIYDAMTDTFAA